MSTPSPAGPSAPKEEKSIRKQLLTRVKTLVKRSDGSGSKRFSLLSTKGKEKAADAEPAKAGEPEAAASESKPAAEQKKLPGHDLEGVVKVPKAQLFEERARKLGERFGLEIEKSEWHSTEGDALRVEKPIRMRVRRTCHKCSSIFGASKECSNCQHVRCTKCTRNPPRRTEEEKAASRAKRAAIAKAQKENPPLIADWRYDDKEPFVLKRPSKTGGQDLVHKKPRQRIRRNCHECGTLFVTGSKTCEQCSHVRCTDCPRDPPKKDKYPYGYPGDAFGPNSIPYYKCHECKTKFPPNPPGDAACLGCGHKKCDECPRLKPRKVEPEPDPAVLKSLEAKLAALKVTAVS